MMFGGSVGSGRGIEGNQSGASFTLFRCDPVPDVQGTYNWGWTTPLLFKALNSPRSGERFPRRPDDSGEIEAGIFGYWNALQVLLSYSLGWRDHARGLRWWFDHGQPVSDPRLAFMAEVWGLDRTLGAYLEWVHAKGESAQPMLGAKLVGRPAALSPVWESRISQLRDGVRDRQREGRFPYPHGLHLEMGSHAADAPDTEADWVDFQISTTRKNRAYLILPGLHDWYSRLEKEGETLPDETTDAWRVEVVVETVGLIGEFRRSWETGLWFAGPHSLHAVGN